MSTTAAADKKTKQASKATLADVAEADALKQLGWRTDKTARGFIAAEIFGDRRVGPYASLAGLIEAVKIEQENKPARLPGNGTDTAAIEAADELEEQEPETNYRKPPPPPQQKLPGQEDPVYDELDAQGEVYLRALDAKKKATAKLKDETEVMVGLMKKHNIKRYSCGGYSHVIEETDKLVSKPEVAEKKKKDKKSTKEAD